MAEQASGIPLSRAMVRLKSACRGQYWVCEAKVYVIVLIVVYECHHYNNISSVYHNVISQLPLMQLACVIHTQIATYSLAVQYGLAFGNKMNNGNIVRGFTSITIQS